MRQPLYTDDMPALTFFPLSVAKWRTLDSLQYTILMVLTFLSAAAISRTRERAWWLVGLVFLVGVGESVLQIAQVSTGTTFLYGAAESGDVGLQMGGSFVNKNHMAQCVNLSIGAGIALFVSLFERRNHNWTKDSRLLIVGFGLAASAFAIFLGNSRNGVAVHVSRIRFGGNPESTSIEESLGLSTSVPADRPSCDWCPVPRLIGKRRLFLQVRNARNVSTLRRKVGLPHGNPDGSRQFSASRLRSWILLQSFSRIRFDRVAGISQSTRTMTTPNCWLRAESPE